MTESSTHRRQLHVAVGVIRRQDDHILVARRSADQHQGGLWEFPGGKVEPGESVQQALARELHEELGIQIGRSTPLCQVHHDYGDKAVLLDVWMVNEFAGQPHGREGQPLRWVARSALRHEEFPLANQRIIRAVQLPDHIAIVDLAPADKGTAFGHFLQQLPPDTLLRLRAGSAIPDLPVAGVIHDLRDCADNDWQRLTHIRGVHANRHVLRELSQRPVPPQLLFGASCHDAQELDRAVTLGADYALLSPVLATTSHPGESGMGWERFSELVVGRDIAVYAMGGLQQSDLATAQACGARGIAGIRLFVSSDQLR